MENTFYLDIFNKLLLFNDEKIFIIFDKKGNIWFNLNNLLKILGYKDFNKSKKDLNINKDFILKLDDIEKTNFNKIVSYLILSYTIALLAYKIIVNFSISIDVDPFRLFDYYSPAEPIVLRLVRFI